MNVQVTERKTRRSRVKPASTLFATDELVEYLGCVNYATSDRVLKEIKARKARAPRSPITMLVTSAGGPSGTGMGFYDTVRTVLGARLTTIGAGDIDSSGLIIFLAGTTRYVTPHTTSLLHPAGCYFDSSTRYTAQQLRQMAKEYELKDEQYASIVASNSAGRLTTSDVLKLMEAETVLGAADLIRYGLAHAMIESVYKG